MRRASSPVRPLPTAAAEPLPLGDPEVRRSLIRLVRRRVPEREVEDIVQETLADALTSTSPPRDPRALKGWLGGIARHKVVDFHRKACREDLTAEPEVGSGEVESEPGEAADLLRWAERALPGNRTDQQTLEWMLREGEGERLEQIAEGEQIPAERVRQRVARLRRFLREKWAGEMAALIAAGLVGAMLLVWLRGGSPEVVPDGDTSPRRATIEPPELRAAREREAALERCRAGDARGCLEGLDRAAGLDPAGDESQVVRAARREAERALAPSPSPPPPPAPSASPAPGASSRFGKVTSGPRPHSDTAPAAPHRCVCTKGDPLCGCF